MKKLVLILANQKFRVMSMFKTFFPITVAILGLYITISTNILADFYVNPLDGQTLEQLNSDKSACHELAKQQTGIDPMSLSTQSSQRTQGESYHRGRVFSGVLGGHAYGTISDGLPNNAGDDVIIGSPSGGTGNRTMMGAPSGGSFHKGWKSQAEQEQIRAQEEANHHKKLLIEHFNDVYKDCLTDRGYSVY